MTVGVPPKMGRKLHVQLGEIPQKALGFQELVRFLAPVGLASLTTQRPVAHLAAKPDHAGLCDERKPGPEHCLSIGGAMGKLKVKLVLSVRTVAAW